MTVNIFSRLRKDLSSLHLLTGGAAMATAAAGDVDNGGECSSNPPPPACDGSHSDCSVSGAEPLELKEGGRIIGECSVQASRAASKGKGRILRRPRASTEPRAASTSASASSSSLNGRRRFRVGIRRREVELRGAGAGRRDRGDHRVEALALPLGMSIAAVIAQVSSIAKSSILFSWVFFLSRHFTILIFLR